jgi:hypothetical protein
MQDCRLMTGLPKPLDGVAEKNGWPGGSIQV